MLPACSTTPPPATESEKNAALMAYLTCLHDAARKMDDGKSDAMSVALTIKPLCAGEFRTVVKVRGRDMNREAFGMFEDRMEPKQLELATTAVLDERKPRQGKE